MLLLPAEIVLIILSYLPLESLGVLPRVSHVWCDFFDTHQSAIFRAAASLHCWIPPSVSSLDELGAIYSSRSLKGVNTWKDFCRQRALINKSWSGDISAAITPHSAAGQNVHRIKIDEHQGLLITTSSKGGIIVTDIQTERVLWTLPPGYVRSYAHIEYGDGFLIFDRSDGSKEVWRHVLSPWMAPSTISPPDALQRLVSITASTSQSRGIFLPHAHILPPTPTRAYRYVHPTLLLASWNQLHLFDVPSGALVQTIVNIHIISPPPAPPEHFRLLGELNYVELSTRYAFVCGSHALRVFERTPEGRSVLDIPSIFSAVRGWGAWKFRVIGKKDEAGRRLDVEGVHSDEEISLMDLLDEFVAVHVSPCNRHFAALLSTSRLIIVPFWERLITPPAPTSSSSDQSQSADEASPPSLHSIALDIQLGCPRYSSTYLAFCNNGGGEEGRIRVVVATRTGVFVVHTSLPLSPDPLLPSSPPKPDVTIHRIPSLTGYRSLGSVSCVQASDTGIWLNWTGAPGATGANNDVADGEHDIENDGMVVTHEDEDEEEWEDEEEDRFWTTLRLPPRFVRLLDGNRMVLLDAPDRDIDAPGKSMVVSVDFGPL